ncbi:MAG: ComEA family DNA-binding protein [Chloroflexi bacterium]|nr:ComEA family DNA-binding protein [Chloroflexota bacterium]
MEKHREAVGVGTLMGLISLGALGAMLFFIRKPAPASIVIYPITPPAAQTRVPTATPGPILVYVSGAVASPGVYAIPWDSRVEQAVYAAGGALAEADLVRVNLAQRVYDEQQIYVPYKNEQATPILPTTVPRVISSGMSSAPGQKININTASAGELETLPGIGPTLAQRIVDYRQSNGSFQRPEDIKKVKGIGDGIFAQIKDLITVE